MFVGVGGVGKEEGLGGDEGGCFMIAMLVNTLCNVSYYFIWDIILICLLNWKYLNMMELNRQYYSMQTN